MQVASEIVHEALMLGCDILLADGMDDCDPSSTLQTFGPKRRRAFTQVALVQGQRRLALLASWSLWTRPSWATA